MFLQDFLSDTSSEKETGRGKESKCKTLSDENVGKSAGTDESQGWLPCVAIGAKKAVGGGESNQTIFMVTLNTVAVSIV